LFCCLRSCAPGSRWTVPESFSILLRSSIISSTASRKTPWATGRAKYLPFFGTLFIFILFSNLIGIIPGFESPTMAAPVPAGCAIAVFCYYNLMGFREQGVGKYLAHFVGPIWILAPLIVPIEIISHMARPLSLTVRLYANMYAGEQVTLTFLTITYLVVPALFMGLHVFVSLLQAYIFMLLTMMYVSGAVSQEH
jgi:F-type H+-transporting ATPase subunit a